MFKLSFVKKFKKMAKNLDKVTKDKLDNTLDDLAEDPRKPSLRTHKNNKWDAWQSDIDQKYRVVWEYGPGEKEINVLAVGDHKIIE